MSNEVSASWAIFAMDHFKQYLSGRLSKKHTDELIHTDFFIDDTGWCFSLPALFEFLKTRNNPPAKISYKAFRKAIYASDINHQLYQMNAVISIHKSTGSVDVTIYRLSKVVH